MADNMTRAQRSATMSRIRAKDTQVELAVRRMLHSRGYRYRVNVNWLPGKPDIVFTKAKLAVFIDGDFWHGWRFTQWSEKLAPYWRQKIAGNKARDRRHSARLRRDGWAVMRIWEHEVKQDLDRCIGKIEAKLSVFR
jgi:DNA mismatch endonuclease, patch repair protein